MARQTSTNFGPPGLQFPFATAQTDQFSRSDVQLLAQAVNMHDHSSGRGLPVARVASGAVASQVWRSVRLGSAMVTTTSTSMVDIPGLAVSFTTSGTVDLLMNLYLGTIGATGTLPEFTPMFAIQLDGVDRTFSWFAMTPPGGSPGQVVPRRFAHLAIGYLVSDLTAGPHAVSARWQTGLTGGALETYQEGAELQVAVLQR